MKRTYASGTDSDAVYFTGTEIEHTPAYGLPTLFVTGVQPTADIASRLNGAKHIFFGANHSFHPTDNLEWARWEGMIGFFLQKDYLCSLDIPVDVAEEFHESGLNEYNNFIPQIRVPLPYIKLWNYNTMLKLDDKDFNATNPGVWSHSLHELMSRKAFTDWTQYSNDEIVK